MTNFSDLVKFLNIMKEQPSYKVLINQLPLNKFISLKLWKYINSQMKNSNLVIFIYRPILLHSELSVNTDKSFAMSIGYLHYLLSNVLPVGYIIQLPKNIRLQVTDSFISATLGKLGIIPTVPAAVPLLQHELMDNKLSVYSQSSTVIVSYNNKIIDFLS